jgi:aspartate aminotransferase-like enzyme
VPAKRYLFTPGPTPVPPEVLAALAEPIVHHRGADFRPIYAECIARLKEICRTSSDALLFTASGTGAMESAVANLCSPGTRVVVVSAGAFGERWVEIAERYGCDVVPLRYAWGEVPAAADLERLLTETDGVRAVFLTHSETSTGVVSDLHAFANATRPSGAHVVVDAVSSLGAVPLEMDAWGIDVVCSGSQKALMTPRLRCRLEPRGPLVLAALLLRLGADAQGAGCARRALHPGGLDRPGAQRRARAAARRRA